MAEQQNHLYLVDGSSYIFRAYHRLPPLTNRHGVPAGAVYGYTSMLWKLADGLNKADGPTHMAVILDASSQTFRNDMYDQYKANRPPPPEDLVPQFPLIRTATRAFSIPCIETEGLEADDIIACYCQAAAKAGWKVTIVSSDKDLMQLVEDGSIDMLDTMNDRRIDRAYVENKFGVGPDRLGDVLALMGDSVDNVPGVPGIGPKTAAQLINEYGDLAAVLASTDRITKPKLKQSLIDHADNARLSRELVRLVCDSPLPEPLEELALKGIPPEPLKAFLEDMGFKSLLNRVGGPSSASAGHVAAMTSAPAPAAAPAEAEKIVVDRTIYETVTSEEALDRWIAESRHQGYVAVDTETDCIDCIIARLVGVSLATAANKACYIPIGHGGGDLLSETPSQLPVRLVLDRLKPLLEDPAVLKIGHNLKYDWVMFDKAGIDVAPYDDTLVMSFDLDAGRSNHGMDELAKLHFDHECISFKSVCGVGKNQVTFDKVPLDTATEYAAEDADITLRLWQRLKPRIAREGSTSVYEMVDRPLVATVGRMERRGVKVDRDYLSKLSGTFATEIAALEQRIYEAAEGPFTIGSPQQLGSVLFDRLGLKGGRKGKSGQYSTDVTELERLAAEGIPVAQLVLEWRQLSKLKSTYTDALQAQINPETGRVHTSFSLSGAQTGRLSSTEPNLQNIPIRTEIGRQIRDAFVAEPGHVLMSADYSQIERFRLAAHMADVPQLKEAFAAGKDIHAMTAEELFGHVDRDTRGKAKTVNFSILYGISSWGLAGRLGVPREEGKAIIDRYFERFPGIRTYIDDTLHFARENGSTRTLFGRKTHFPNIRSSQMNLRQGSERAAVNAPIQGTSADLIKRAMNRMDEALAAAGLEGVRMLLQVHDELVFEIPEGREEEAAAVVRRVMAEAAEPAIKLDVPLDVDVGTGAHWGAARIASEPAETRPAPSADLAALARGGRINFFGFVLRLMARLPFLFIAGRIYGPDAAGRFAYAVLIVEFAAQLATLGLKRGLAQQLAKTDKPHVCVVADALLVAAIGSAVAMAILGFFPQAMFPNSKINGLEWMLPITVFALAWSDICLAALAYRHDVGATVRARAIVEPWTISIAAFAWSFISTRDGLIIAYALSMIGAFIASLIPFIRSYGIPHGWSPEPGALWRMARRNLPVAAADAVEWGSRRVDIAVLGLFFAPGTVGIYYVAQQVASLPSKLKTSFDPILGPVISRNLAEGDKKAVARQVRQVGFWVIAAQGGVALALGIPGEGVMGLVGAGFVAGTIALGFLLAAEVVAATAAVSEAALIYTARHRNMIISLVMIALEAAMAAGLILLMRSWGWPPMWQATGPAVALMLALAFSAIVKSRLLSRILGAPVSGWRWPLIWAAAAAMVVGQIVILLPEWAELLFGIPAILGAFGVVLWIKGFGPEDRELFKMRKSDIKELSLPDPSTGADAPV